MRHIFLFIFTFVFLVSNAQLSVRNDAFVFVKDEVVFVKDDINLNEADSKIYLREASQLVQGDGLTGNSGIGELSVYQNGTVNQWTYNYWCSPVGGILNANNSNNAFRVNQTDDPLLATTDPIDSQNSNFTPNANGFASPLTISNSWLWTFVASDSYSDWVYAGNSGDIAPGLGYTMKGIGTAAAGNQTYDFRGKPNNGDITNTVLDDQFTLVGNPYPSAMDAALYIHDADNVAAINGTLYYWEQDGTTNSHYLEDYIGGYYEFTINAAGDMITDTPAAFKTYDAQDNVYPLMTPRDGVKSAGRYIPIGQGFMVRGEVGSSGTVYTKNSHRVYEKEGADSYFFRNNNDEVSKSESDIKTERIQTQDNGLTLVPDDYMRFRINVDFTVNAAQYTRQLVLNFHESATDGFDRGLELIRAENYPNDAYFKSEGRVFSGQAFPFEDNLTIPLTLDIEVAQPLRFRIFDIQNFEDTQGIYLHDLANDTYADLRQQDYEINILPGNYSNRFEIVFVPQDLLSIEDSLINTLKIRQDNTNKQLTILNPNNLEIAKVEVFDITGKVITNQSYDTIKNNYKLSTANFSEGVYVVNVTSVDNSSQTQKIIVKN
ncbi:T9SS type A sorting domain-containing protein [Winogradskyella ursingii]|uniref:T9SS type A sorting domain-containing protein n=1 Tax=Winogradskyella ursingii TaxID=2686079 RepID=UPI0015C97A30|nr:T9SS type A sorting domain-containing protein [Winogradskyella ursingii]